jgi:MSHA pilin protein MshC
VWWTNSASIGKKNEEPAGSFFFATKATAGFTLPELVAVLVLMSVLAVVALPRLWGSTFDQLTFYDDTLTALRYAQRTAVTHQRTVCATFTATQLTLTYASVYGSTVCDQPLVRPGGTTQYQITAASGTSYTAASTFRFDRVGIPNINQTITFSGGQTLIVEAGTGYVH